MHLKLSLDNIRIESVLDHFVLDIVERQCRYHCNVPVHHCKASVNFNSMTSDSQHCCWDLYFIWIGRQEASQIGCCSLSLYFNIFLSFEWAERF